MRHIQHTGYKNIVIWNFKGDVNDDDGERPWVNSSRQFFSFLSLSLCLFSYCWISFIFFLTSLVIAEFCGWHKCICCVSEALNQQISDMIMRVHIWSFFVSAVKCAWIEIKLKKMECVHHTVVHILPQLIHTRASCVCVRIVSAVGVVDATFDASPKANMNILLRKIFFNTKTHSTKKIYHT